MLRKKILQNAAILWHSFYFILCERTYMLRKKIQAIELHLMVHITKQTTKWSCVSQVLNYKCADDMCNIVHFIIEYY